MNPLRWPVKVLLCLALVLRLLPILATHADQIVPDWSLAGKAVPLDQDGLGYASYARHLWQGEGYHEDTGDRSHRSPGYPALIALTFCLGGYQFLVLRIFQALLGTAACWLIGRIARAGWGEKAGRWALLASAVYLPFIFYSPQVLNSILYLTLVAATLAALVWASDDGKGDPARAALPGFCLGLAALTAGTVLGAAPVMAVWLAWSLCRGGWARALGAAALMTAVTCAVLAPWIARNWKEHHAFILLDTNSGGVLYLGNVNYDNWVDHESPDALDEVRRTTDYSALDEAGKDRLLRGLAVSWMKAHPGEFLRVWMAKFLHGWNPVPSGKPWPMTAASLVTYGLVLALGLWGAWKSIRARSSVGGLLIAYLLAISITHAVFVIAQRHRVPLFDPALIALGAGVP